MEWDEPAEWTGDDETAEADSDEWVWLWVESGIGETDDFCCVLFVFECSCSLGGGGSLSVLLLRSSVLSGCRWVSCGGGGRAGRLSDASSSNSRLL